MLAPSGHIILPPTQILFQLMIYLQIVTISISGRNGLMTIAPVQLITVFQLRIKCLVSKCHISECSIHFKCIVRWHNIQADTFEAQIPSICEFFLGKFITQLSTKLEQKINRYNLWDMAIYSANKGQITPFRESFRQQMTHHSNMHFFFFVEVQPLLQKYHLTLKK